MRTSGRPSSLIILLFSAFLSNLPVQAEGQADIAEADHTPIVVDTCLATAIDLQAKGKCDELVEYSRRILAADSEQFELIGYEVLAGILGDSPYEYIDACLNDTSGSLLSRFRRVALLATMARHKTALDSAYALAVDYPENSWVVLWQGISANDLGQESLALRFFADAARDSSVYWRSMKNEAFLRLDLGQFEKADSLASRLLEHPVFAYVGEQIKARTKWVTGNWRLAVKELESASKRLSDPFMYCNLARTLRYLGRYSEAIRVLEEAHTIWPENKWVCADLSLSYSTVGLEDRSLELISDFEPVHIAYMTNPGNLIRPLILNDTLAFQEAARGLFSDIFRETSTLPMYTEWLDGRGRESETDSLIEAISLFVSPADIAELRGLRVLRENPGEAVEILNSAIENSKCFDNPHATLVEWLFKAGRFSEAYALANKILAVFPGWTRLFYSLAECEYLAHNRDRALTLLDSLDVIAPGCCEVSELRALIYIELGRTAEAAAINDSMAARYPCKPYEVSLYTQLYGNSDKAKLAEIARGYLERDCRSAQLLLAVASALSAAGDYDTADSLLTDAIKQHPKAAELYWTRGWVANDAGKIQAAQNDFQRARDLDPFNERYGSALMTSSMQTIPLDSAGSRGYADTAGLARISVDSILALSGQCNLEPSELGGVRLVDKSQYIYFDKYRSLYRLHQTMKLTTALAAQYYGELNIPFNAYRSKPYLLEARTILPNGEVVPLNLDKVVITSPPVGPDSPDLSDTRMMSFSFPAVDSGVILDYIVQFEYGYAEPDYLYFDSYMLDFEPSMVCEIELIVPSNWPIVYEQPNECEFRTFDSAGVTGYVWRLENNPALKWEEYSPPFWEIAAQIRAGYARTWRETVEAHWRLVEPNIEATAAIKDLARKIAGGSLRREDKIDRLFRYVADSIRYVAVEYGEGSIIPRPASEVAVNKYGDCKDKVILLISLLKTLGIEAHPMLVAGSDMPPLSPEIPSLATFDHVIAYLPGQPGRFLDPTCPACEPGEMLVDYMGRQGVVLGKDVDTPLVAIPPPTSDDNVFVRRVRMAPQSSGGVLIYCEVNFEGTTALILKQNLKTAGYADARAFVQEQSKTGIWAAAVMGDFEMYGKDQPGRNIGWAAALSVDSVFMRGQSSDRALISFNSLNLMLEMPDTTERVYDFCYESPVRVKDEFVIVPGENWELDSKPSSWKVDTSWFVASCEAIDRGDSLQIQVDFELKQQRIPAGEVHDFAVAVRSVQKKVERQSPIFKRHSDNKRVEALTKALEASPGDISLLVSLADLYLGQDQGGRGCLGIQNRKQARHYLTRALQVNPDNETLVMRLVSLMGDDRLFLEADTVLRAFEALRGGTLPPTLSMMKAGVSAALGNYEEALKLFETTMTYSPSDEFRIQIVKLNAELGRKEEARRHIELMKTLSAEPYKIAFAEFYYYVTIGELDSAETLVNRWRGANAALAETLKLQLYDEREEWSRALAEVKSRMTRGLENPETLNGCAWYLALADSNLTEALELSNRSLELVGGCHPSYLNTRGFIHLKMNNVTLARQDLMASLSDQTLKSRSLNHYLLGECCLAENNTQAAREHFDKAVSFNGDRWSAKMAQTRLDEITAAESDTQ